MRPHIYVYVYIIPFKGLQKALIPSFPTKNQGVVGGSEGTASASVQYTGRVHEWSFPPRNWSKACDACCLQGKLRVCMHMYIYIYI